MERKTFIGIDGLLDNTNPTHQEALVRVTEPMISLLVDGGGVTSTGKMIATSEADLKLRGEDVDWLKHDRIIAFRAQGKPFTRYDLTQYGIRHNSLVLFVARGFAKNMGFEELDTGGYQIKILSSNPDIYRRFDKLKQSLTGFVNLNYPMVAYPRSTGFIIHQTLLDVADTYGHGLLNPIH